MEDLFDLKAFFLMNAEEKVIFLNEIIDEELSKSTEQIDCELIDECINFIGEITGDWIHMSEEEAKELFQILWKKAEHDINNNDKDGNTTFSGKPKKKTKKFFLIAAIVASLFALGFVIAGANDLYTSFSSNFFGISFKDLFKHEVYKEGNITYINQNTDEAKYYCSVEDFAKGENIQGLFFPEELEIKEIMYSEADGNQKIIFNPVDQSGCFCITATTNDMYGISSNLPTYTKDKTEGGIDVWLYEKTNASPETGTIQIMFNINQWYYSIQASDSETALRLIDNFKEILP